jgi:hypothetical protein
VGGDARKNRFPGQGPSHQSRGDFESKSPLRRPSVLKTWGRNPHEGESKSPTYKSPKQSQKVRCFHKSWGNQLQGIHSRCRFVSKPNITGYIGRYCCRRPNVVEGRSERGTLTHQATTAISQPYHSHITQS